LGSAEAADMLTQLPVASAMRSSPFQCHPHLETRRPRRVFPFAIAFSLSEFPHAMDTLHRHLPHLNSFARYPIVFLTVVTLRRRTLLACRESHDALVDTWNLSASVDGWFVGRFVLMPDHVHLFTRAAVNAKSLAGWVQTWKSLSSRRIAGALNARPPVWQKDYFDRFLRSADNYQAKWNYVEMNPVRKGLCSRPTEWPWRGALFDLRF
jgi:putative transposase